jgi:Ca2+/Na+ antiporter
MQNFDELKNIWQQEQQHDMPGAEEILSNISRARKSLSQNVLKAILQLVPAFIVVICIFLLVHFNSPLTYMGIVIIMLSIAVYGYFVVRHYINLSKDYSLLRPSEYLTVIQKQYEVRKKFNTLGGLVYSVILYAGIILYMIEVADHLSMLWQAAGYTLITAWFLYVYFVLSKKVMKSENEKFEMIIQQLKRLAGQFEE